MSAQVLIERKSIHHTSCGASPTLLRGQPQCNEKWQTCAALAAGKRKMLMRRRRSRETAINTVSDTCSMPFDSTIPPQKSEWTLNLARAYAQLVTRRKPGNDHAAAYFATCTRHSPKANSRAIRCFRTGVPNTNWAKRGRTALLGERSCSARAERPKPNRREIGYIGGVAIQRSLPLSQRPRLRFHLCGQRALTDVAQQHGVVVQELGRQRPVAAIGLPQ